MQMCGKDTIKSKYMRQISKGEVWNHGSGITVIEKQQGNNLLSSNTQLNV